MDTADSPVFTAEGARPERQATWPLRQDVFVSAVAEGRQSAENATAGFEHPLDDAVGLGTQDVGFKEPEFDQDKRWSYEVESPFQTSGEQRTSSTRDLLEAERWSGSPEQVAFREAVLKEAIERRRKKKPPKPDLQPSQLATVPGTNIQMAVAAAARASELLQAANEAIAAARRAGAADIGTTVRVTAQSGYRGSDHQARVWRGYFERYYRETDEARRRLPGGPHSPAAIAYMLDVYRIPRRIAAPGYSNHQAGTAIDFRQIIKGTDRIRNSTSDAAIARWRNSWFFRWLQENAARFGFQPYSAEPWHWEYRPAGAQREAESFVSQMEESEAQVGDELEDRGPEEAEEPERAMWNEGEQWEANEYGVDGHAAAEPRGEAEYEDLEFEALVVEEALGPEEAEGLEFESPPALASTDPEFEDLEHQLELDDVPGEALLAQLLSEGFVGAIERLEESDQAPTELGSRDELDESEVTFEEFVGSEHKSIGNLASGTVPTSINFGVQNQPLTFGDVVAMAGDYFGTYFEMAELARTPRGRVELAYARWKCLELKEPPPAADDAQRKAVMDRYFSLASSNVSHFSAGGTGWQAYSTWHTHAFVDALQAGQTSNPAMWQRALTKEAFADHFLTDIFSSGHVRTPRSEMQQWYTANLPKTSDRLLQHMAEFMYERLKQQGQIGWRLRAVQFLSGYVVRKMIERIHALGGEAVKSFSIGDIVGLALHDMDNRGLDVVSTVDAAGRVVSGGHPWRAVGDGHLDKAGAPNAETKAMAVAAVKASLRDLEKVRQAGIRLGTRSVPPAQQSAAIRTALGSVPLPGFGALPVFGASPFVPLEDKTSRTTNVPMFHVGATTTPLDWRWGQLGDVAYRAVDDTVKIKICRELTDLAGDISDCVSAGPGGIVKICGIRDAVTSYAQVLHKDGIKALEKAVGKPAR